MGPSGMRFPDGPIAFGALPRSRRLAQRTVPQRYGEQRAQNYRNRLSAVSRTVTTMNVIMPTLPYTVLVLVPRGSSSGAM